MPLACQPTQISPLSLSHQREFESLTDEDGDIDIIAAHTQGANQIYFNDGLGTSFTTATTSFSSTVTFGITIADMDADGDLDLLFAQAILVGWHADSLGR